MLKWFQPKSHNFSQFSTNILDFPTVYDLFSGILKRSFPPVFTALDSGVITVYTVCIVLLTVRSLGLIVVLHVYTVIFTRVYAVYTVYAITIIIGNQHLCLHVNGYYSYS